MSGVAVLTSAAHVMSPCWRIVGEQEDAGADDLECPPTLFDPREVPGEASIRLAQRGGGPAASEWSAHFPLFNPMFPVADAAAANLLPRNDWSVYVVDNQLFAAFSGSHEIVPDPVVESAPGLYDPLKLTESESSWANPTGGSSVLVIGFPTNDGNVDGRVMHASVGVVLELDDAIDAIALLDSLGDSEGRIPYDHESEFIFEGHALPGMSGSGVFDADGVQIGIVVRASFSDIAVQYVRAVRMSYVAETILTQAALQSPETQSAIGRFLPPLGGAG